jgi:hypothetical protein
MSQHWGAGRDARETEGTTPSLSRQDVVPLIRRIRHLERCTKVEVECIALAKQVLATPPARVDNRLYYHRSNIVVSGPATIIPLAAVSQLRWLGASLSTVAPAFELNDRGEPRSTTDNTVKALRALSVSVSLNESGSLKVGERLMTNSTRLSWLSQTLFTIYGIRPHPQFLTNALRKLV